MPRPVSNPNPAHAVPRLKIVRPDFDALRAERDATIERWANEFAIENNIQRSDVVVFGAHGCYCACAEGGPCEHQFSGWREGPGDGGGWVGETVCKLCGMGAMAHSMKVGP